MAEDFARLEDDTYHPETTMGQEWCAWIAGKRRRSQTPQARSNFIVTRVFAYLNPNPSTPEEKESEFKKSIKERMTAQNVNMMVRIVPLMGKSTWKGT
jgi:hypothetical protein